MLQDHEYLATGRRSSLFERELVAHEQEIDEGVRGMRIAVIGAAGSIGGSVLRNLLRSRPKAMALIDLSENNLVEVVRDLRSSAGLWIPENFEALPIALGSMECRRYFLESPPFDYIFNLSAIKHVRSEKNIYSLMRMVDTNVLFPNELLRSLPYRCRKFFSVSSDKATAPANLMGATKRVMEKMLLWNSEAQPFSSARFANVAFSDGSLPRGFLHRIEKRQAISAPNDVRRYFMSHEESGQICLLSCILGENRDVFFPILEKNRNEKTFSEIAVELLRAYGFEAIPCDSEEEARSRVEELLPRKKWPCYFFRSDTTGEKEFEEFFLPDDRLDLERFRTVGVVKQSLEDVGPAAMVRFLRFATDAKSNPRVRKEDYVRELEMLVPDLTHVEKGKNLDQKM